MGFMKCNTEEGGRLTNSKLDTKISVRTSSLKKPIFFQQKKSFKKKSLKKNAISLVLPIEEISLWPELSSPARFRIQGGYPEFLKAATMRPCGRAKIFRYCARFGFLNPILHNSPHFHHFWVISLIFLGFLCPFTCAKFSNKKFGRAK